MSREADGDRELDRDSQSSSWLVEQWLAGTLSLTYHQGMQQETRSERKEGVIPTLGNTPQQYVEDIHSANITHSLPFSQVPLRAVR